jgi:A/G-specific adenine glycosylase
MLQQTQVAAVIPYYERFIARYADVHALSRARQEDVLALWSGLGYYARGRNLHAAARRIAALGKFPDNVRALCDLPGIGRSTAGAIAALAFGRRAPILDGNARRVFARCFGIEDEKALWTLAERLVPSSGVEAYTQGLMDLGATLCTRHNPQCDACPVKRGCFARRNGSAAALPARRSRKPTPVKNATWYILLHAREVLLVRRPPSGIWGGMWAFPEKRPANMELAAKRKLAVLEHGFTHLRLRVQPIVCELKRKLELADSLWLELSDASSAAVPAPVRKLLLSLAGSKQSR